MLAIIEKIAGVHIMVMFFNGIYIFLWLDRNNSSDSPISRMYLSFIL